MSTIIDGSSGITTPGLVNSGNETVSGTLTASGFNAASTFGFKNRLINGAMQVWQRGTTSGSAGYQTADRWYENASASTTFSKETSFLPAGYTAAFKMTANATAQMYLQQAIETLNCADLAGQNVTVSAQVAASTALNAWISIYYSTSTDNPVAGTWTYLGTSIQAVGTSYGQISGTFAIPSNAKTVLVWIGTAAAVSAGTSLYITGVQLEKGSTATSFDVRPYGSELQLCQRYYQSWGGDSLYDLIGLGQCCTTTTADVLINFLVKMRAAPTLGYSSLSNFFITNAANVAQGITAFTLDQTTTQTYSLLVTVASGLVAGNCTRLHANNTTAARITMSSEL